MKNEKITIEFLRIDKGFVFRILEMDERFLSKSYKAKNGSYIKSLTYPAIGSDSVIYVHGNISDKKTDWVVVNKKSNKETDWVVVNKKSNKEAEEYIEKIKEAFIDWSENWEGFRKDNTSANEFKIEKSEIFKC